MDIKNHSLVKILVTWATHYNSRGTIEWINLVVFYHHWSSLIWHEEEGFPSNVGLSKPKMTTSATLGLGKNQTSGTLQPLVHAF